MKSSETYCVLFMCVVCQAAELKVLNNGPVVWGSNITFEAVLSGTFDWMYTWTWEDDAHTPKVEQDRHLTAQLTKSYQNPGNYTMTVSVKFLFFPIAKVKNNFRIEATIPGELVITVGNQSLPANRYISSNQETFIQTKLYDPEDFLKNVTINYWFYVDNILFANTGPNFTYTFTVPGDFRIMVFVNAYVHSEEIRWASYHTLIKVRDPIQTVNVTGNTMLRRGDIVHLTAECDGSSPWSYCWKAIDNENATEQDTSCSDLATTNKCEFQIIWYFKNTGHHKILVNITNDVNRQIKFFIINIFNELPQPQLSVVIIPVLCSLLAITIILVGFLYFIQARNRFIIEVADFDFTSSDSMTYQTFCEQLKEAIVNALPQSSEILWERNWNFLDCRTDADTISISSTSSTRSELKAGESCVEVATAMALP